MYFIAWAKWCRAFAILRKEHKQKYTANQTTVASILYACGIFMAFSSQPTSQAKERNFTKNFAFNIHRIFVGIADSLFFFADAMAKAAATTIA